VATELHKRLMLLSFELSSRGGDDLAAWIQKHVAEEQRQARRRRGVPKVAVTLGKTGKPAYVPKALVDAAKEQGE